MPRRPRFSQGIFVPSNPNKYVGTHRPRYRSGWEFSFMNMCDRHPNISSWASEAIRIPYICPITGRKTAYVPDFLLVYTDKRGKVRKEVVEVKPSRQTTVESATNAAERKQAVMNKAKWNAANEWCKKYGMAFRVVTEKDMFANPTKRRKK